MFDTPTPEKYKISRRFKNSNFGIQHTRNAWKVQSLLLRLLHPLSQQKCIFVVLFIYCVRWVPRIRTSSCYCQRFFISHSRFMVHVCLLRKHNKIKPRRGMRGQHLGMFYGIDFLFLFRTMNFSGIIKKFRLQLAQQSLTPLNVFNSSIQRNCFKHCFLLPPLYIKSMETPLFQFWFLLLNLLLFTWHFEIISMKFHHWFTLFYFARQAKASFEALKWKLENFIAISTFKCSALSFFTIVPTNFDCDASFGRFQSRADTNQWV